MDFSKMGVPANSENKLKSPASKSKTPTSATESRPTNAVRQKPKAPSKATSVVKKESPTPKIALKSAEASPSKPSTGASNSMPASSFSSMFAGIRCVVCFPFFSSFIGFCPFWDVVALWGFLLLSHCCFHFFYYSLTFHIGANFHVTEPRGMISFKERQRRKREQQRIENEKMKRANTYANNCVASHQSSRVLAVYISA